MVVKLGDVLSCEGYCGYFEVDLLYDLDVDEFYFGEVNLCFFGVSLMMNLIIEVYVDMLLFFFYLFEYMDVDYELDIEVINLCWEWGYGEDEVWGQLIMLEILLDFEFFIVILCIGMWCLNYDGCVFFVCQGNDWVMMFDEFEVFYMWVVVLGDLCCEGV